MKHLKFNFYSLILIGLFSIGFVACEDDDDDIETTIIEKIVDPSKHSVSISMSQMVNNDSVQMDTLLYTNEKGQKFSVTRLRYMISDLSFHKADGSSFTINEYHLVDITKPATLVWNPTTKVPEGDYTAISFKFGFDREDNIENQYADLNTAIWNWPDPLGGGYHYMQLEGRWEDGGNSGGYATHMGTARHITATDTTYEDNHFVAKPMNSAISIPAKTSFELVMNIEEWYRNPYTWDFNIYNMMLMPNYEAQRKLNLNGPSVFTVNI